MCCSPWGHRVGHETIQIVFPLSEKMKVPKLRKGKKLYTEVVKICGKNESFFCEILKKEKEFPKTCDGQ